MKVKVKLKDLYTKSFEAHKDYLACRGLTGFHTCDETIEIEAEPINEKPEWENRLENNFMNTIGKISARSESLKDFIRTEIIEKICEEIIQEKDADRYSERTVFSLVEAVKARWLRRGE